MKTIVSAAIMSAFLLLPGWGGEAGARVVFQETFAGAAQGEIRGTPLLVDLGNGKRGWSSPRGGDTETDPSYIAYDVGPLFKTLNKGTVEFHLKRDESHFFESVFSVTDMNKERLFSFRMEWEGYFDKRYPEITYYSPGGDLIWYTRIPRGGRFGNVDTDLKNIPMRRPVGKGQWIHVAMTWGVGEENALYVDNVSLAARLAGDPSRLSALIRRGEKLFIGAEPIPPSHKKVDGAYGMTTSVIRGFKIHDTVFPGGTGESNGTTINSVDDDSFKMAGISGKLVAGDTVNVELKASPGGAASFDMGNVKGIALAEAPPTEAGPGIPAVDNGTYRGAYTIKAGDDFENGRIVGHFTSQDNVAAEPVASASKWTIDTKPVVTFNIDKKDLPADSSTKARIKLVAKDANGNPVKGRHLKLTLGTTDEYTGTVGAGDFGKDVGATVETRWRGETDSWGEVEFDYTAGFAAKTVILSAKDLDSGGVSVEYLTAYKEASIDIALTPPVNRAAARRGLMYVLKVEASRTELTADGRSRSVIRATLLDPGGKAVAGDPVAFSLSSPNGTVRTINGTTDGSGTATAEYTAGKKIGIVVVTATATLRNASDSVSITLLSDAPAKIYLKARPESLPADGFSRADLSVKVTDINDNPNADTKVEFRVAKGGGKLDSPVRVTDRFGDAADRYTSGTTPGVATILATVRSKVPSESELAKGKNVLFAPYSADSDEIRVEKWLKRKGEGFVKGDPLVEYTLSRGRTVYTLSAPYDGTMGQQFVEYWDRAEVGQTLAVLHPAPGGR